MRSLMLMLAVAMLAGCARTVGGEAVEPGVVDPPAELEPGIEVVERIPDELPSDGPSRIDHGDVCGSLPATAVAELGFGEPHDRWGPFCQWLDRRTGHHFVNVGYGASLTASAEDAGSLRSHVRYLRIEGHYALEEILDYDPMQSCSVTVHYGAPETLLVTTYTGVQTPTETAVDGLCPRSREVAKAMIGELAGS